MILEFIPYIKTSCNRTTLTIVIINNILIISYLCIYKLIQKVVRGCTRLYETPQKLYEGQVYEIAHSATKRPLGTTSYNQKGLLSIVRTTITILVISVLTSKVVRVHELVQLFYAKF